MNLIRTMTRHRMPLMYLVSAALAVSLTACPDTGISDGPPDTTPPAITDSNPPLAPAPGFVNAPTNRRLTVTFDEAMDASTINSATFTLTGPNATPVDGTVSYDAASKTASFTPKSPLAASTLYTGTLSTGVKDVAGNALAAPYIWSFTTGTSAALGPEPVILGTAGTFVLLAKTGVSTTGTTAVVGNIGLSPAARSYITGFSETLDATNKFATSAQVTGKIYASNMAVPTPAKMTTAISDMETAYTAAAGRPLPDSTELLSGNISGQTLAPGLYKWGTGVLMTSNVTLAGGANDVWIFQVGKGITVGNGAKVLLSGGAVSKNIFWQAAESVTLGTTSEFKGVILSKTMIAFKTGAKLDGRALAQTAITLDANAVTQPAQ